MPAGLPLTLPSAYTAATLRFNSGSLNFENKKPNYGAIAAFIASSPFLLSQAQINQEKRSFERDVQIPVIKKMTVSLIDGRLCDFDGDEAGTDKIILTFSVKGFVVKCPTDSMLKDNTFKSADLLAQALYHAWNAWYAWVENLCITFAKANKSTVLADVPDYFTKTASSYVSQKGADFYVAYQYALGQNFLNAAGDYIDITSAASVVTQKRMGMNGTANNTNEAGLLVGLPDMYPTNFLVPGNGYGETHLIMTKGAVGFYNWVSPYAVDNYVDIPEKDFWFTERDPMFNYFTASVHYKHKCSNKTVGHGGASDVVYYDHYEYTIDNSLVKAYTSTAGESPIFEFNLTNPS